MCSATSLIADGTYWFDFLEGKVFGWCCALCGRSRSRSKGASETQSLASRCAALLTFGPARISRSVVRTDAPRGSATSGEWRIWQLGYVLQISPRCPNRGKNAQSRVIWRSDTCAVRLAEAHNGRRVPSVPPQRPDTLPGGPFKTCPKPPIFAVEHSWHPALSLAALGTPGFARTRLRQGAPARRPPPPPVLFPSRRSLLRPLLRLRPWLLQLQPLLLPRLPLSSRHRHRPPRRHALPAPSGLP